MFAKRKDKKAAFFGQERTNAGMAIKDLQYLMGHSDADVTLNVYTHASYAHAESAMRKIL